MSLNHEAFIRCPNCQHEHRRVIQDGKIHEKGRYVTDAKEKVLTTMATYHKEPLSERMRAAHASKEYTARRDGVQLTGAQLDRWAEIAQREQTGVGFDD